MYEHAFPGEVAIRRSATVIVVRDAPAGIEVLMLRRAERGDQNSGAWVFPGGLLDAADRRCEPYIRGLDAAAADARLGLAGGEGLDHVVCALRECFEEAGLLFACDAAGAPLPLHAGERASRIAAWRAPMARGERALADLCEAEGLTLRLDAFVYCAHWLTAPGMPKRFDTRFFIARAPEHQEALHDADELVEQLWLSPAEALARGDALKLMLPTRTSLQHIGRFADVAALLADARARDTIPCVMPRLAAGARGKRPVLPDEPAYAEIARLDPGGRGDVSCEIRVGVPVRLSDRVIRVTAGNGSVMTGPGTNTYLVGGGPANRWAVIDPGPDDAAHLEAVLAAAPGPIRWILATHTHRDHSPGCVALRERTGAPVLGMRPRHPEWQDATFAPDRELAGGESIEIDAGTTLGVVHTPGHASNHLCFRLEEERLLFTGDHVMQLSTVVINPPDGDMAAYLRSLRALAQEPLEWLAPGHGFLIPRPREAFEKIVAHRLRREAKVLAAVQRLGPAAVEGLLGAVYDDVPPALHGAAQRSLLAHLLKLEEEGVVCREDDRWSAVTRGEGSGLRAR